MKDKVTKDPAASIRARLLAHAKRAEPPFKFGWMTPREYARAISGQTGDRAAQPGGSARTPLATHLNEGSDHPRTLVMAG